MATLKLVGRAGRRTPRAWDPYGVLWYCVGNRGYREWVAARPGWYGCGFCQVGAGVLFHVRHDFSGSQVVGESDGRTGMITHHDCGDMLEFACWLTHWLLSSWPDPLSIHRAFVSSRSLIS